MRNGPPPACPDGTVNNARWLFPQEQAPPPRNEGCKQNVFGDPAPHTSNGSPPTPSPPSKSSPPLSASTSFPTLTTMGGIAPADAFPPPAILTEWHLYTSPDGLDGSFMVNLRSGERLWQPPASDWDYEWDIEPIPNPEGTWYRDPGSQFFSRSNLYLAASESMTSIPLIMGEVSLFSESSSAVPYFLDLLIWL